MSSSSSFSPPQPFSVSSSSFMEADEDEEGRERRNPSNSEIRKGRDVSHISQRSTGETYPPDQTSPLSSSSFFSSLQSSDSSSKSYGGKGSLSAAQLLFLEEGIACNVREDGRSCIDIRPSDVYVHVLPKSASSSLVCSTENVVLCGVSMQLAKPSRGEGDEGEVYLTVDCSPGVGTGDGGGSSLGDAILSKKEHFGSLREGRGGGGGDYSSLQSLLMDMMLGPRAIDRKKLCVTPGKAIWRVFLDCMILKAGGGLLDAISLAIYAALRNTYLPCVFVDEEEEGEDEDEEGGGEIKVTCDERETAGDKFPAEDIPLLITVGQIRNRYVWDMSSHEETASACRLLVSIHRNFSKEKSFMPRCTGIQKLGGSLLDLAALPTVIVNSQRVCKEIFDRVERQLEKQKTQKRRQELHAFTKVIEQL